MGGMESVLLSTLVTKYSHGPGSSAPLFPICKKVSNSMAFSSSPRESGVPSGLAHGAITPAQMVV